MNGREGKGRDVLGATMTVVIFRHGYLCSPLQFYNHKSSPKRLSVIELFISPGSQENLQSPRPCCHKDFSYQSYSSNLQPSVCQAPALPCSPLTAAGAKCWFVCEWCWSGSADWRALKTKIIDQSPRNDVVWICAGYAQDIGMH